MTKLLPCSRCGSFLPTAARACPGCQRPIVRARRLPAPVRTLLTIGGGGLLSLTLSACYGAPCTGGACEPYDAGTDAGFTVDAGGPDAGETASDGGASDAGSTDAGSTDAGETASDAGEASDGGAAADAAL